MVCASLLNGDFYKRNVQLQIFVSSFKTNVMLNIFMTVIENTKVEF